MRFIPLIVTLQRAPRCWNLPMAKRCQEFRDDLVNQKRTFDSLSKFRVQGRYVGGRLANVSPFDRSGSAVLSPEFTDPEIACKARLRRLDKLPQRNGPKILDSVSIRNLCKRWDIRCMLLRSHHGQRSGCGCDKTVNPLQKRIICLPLFSSVC